MASPPPSPVPLKVVGGCSVLLLLAICYNSLGGVTTQTKGGRPTVREAALPLQRRMRKSRFVEEPDVEQVVIPEHFRRGVKTTQQHSTRRGANTAAAALPGATGAGYTVGPNGTVFLSRGWASVRNSSYRRAERIAKLLDAFNHSSAKGSRSREGWGKLKGFRKGELRGT